MKKKILFIHGWMHSAKRYLKLKKLLENKYKYEYEVDIFEFPGFGNTKYVFNTFKKLNVIDYYVKILDEFLHDNNYDLIVTHSMGGYVLLKTIDKNKNLSIDKIILSNTAYGGVGLSKIISWFIPLTTFVFFLPKLLPKKLAKIVMFPVSILTVNNIKYYDDIMVEDALSANSLVAAISLFQISFNKFRINDKWLGKKSVVSYSEKDRVISWRNTKKLINDLKPYVVKKFKNIGHTVVLESEEEYFKFIVDIIEGDK